MVASTKSKGTPARRVRNGSNDKRADPPEAQKYQKAEADPWPPVIEADKRERLWAPVLRLANDEYQRLWKESFEADDWSWRFDAAPGAEIREWRTKVIKKLDAVARETRALRALAREAPRKGDDFANEIFLPEIATLLAGLPANFLDVDPPWRQAPARTAPARENVLFAARARWKTLGRSGSEPSSRATACASILLGNRPTMNRADAEGVVLEREVHHFSQLRTRSRPIKRNSNEP